MSRVCPERPVGVFLTGTGRPYRRPNIVTLLKQEVIPHDDLRFCSAVPYRHRLRPAGPFDGYSDVRRPDASSYPPYNIEKTGEETYRLTMAVAGFQPEELDLVVKDNTMVVSGKVNAPRDRTGEMLYRGIAGRAFERRFVLADHIVVDGADLEKPAASRRPEARGSRGAGAAPHRDRRRLRQGGCERQPGRRQGCLTPIEATGRRGRFAGPFWCTGGCRSGRDLLSLV